MNNLDQPATAIVSVIGGQAFTTSLAIAEGTDTQHKNVMELVRTYIVDLEEFGRVAFETRPFATAGGTQQREIAILNEQQSALVLTFMRNTEIVVGFKKRLIKAFWEMARQLAEKPAALSRLELIQMAMQAEQERLALEAKVAIIEPKADALDRLSACKGSLCITDAAKALKVKPSNLFDFLKAHHWRYKRIGGKNWLGYQDKIDTGLVENYFAKVNDAAREGVLITPRGVTKLAELINRRDSVRKLNGTSQLAIAI